MEKNPFICLISEDFVENSGQFESELSRFHVISDFDKLLKLKGETSLNSLSYIQKYFPQKTRLIQSIGCLYDKFSKKKMSFLFKFTLFISFRKKRLINTALIVR